MQALRKSWSVVVLAGACLALAPGARADGQAPGQPPAQSPEQMAREGLEQMLQALRLLVDRIPQYELPEVLPNGDIIIRRKHPKPKPDSDEPELHDTSL